MDRSCRSQRFLAGDSRSKIEKFVKGWFESWGYATKVSFVVTKKDKTLIYEEHLELIPLLVDYLERFLTVQLDDGKRKWVNFTQKQLCEVYRKVIDFHSWRSCKGVGSQYRRK